MTDNIHYPLRINKYLAHKKICSRREADQLIVDGKIFINGTKAELGVQVHEGDNVVLGEGAQKKKAYYAFYKPRGVVTHSPQRDEKSIEHVVTFVQEVFPMGRLDKESEGLIIMTNDGRVTDRLLNPKRKHEKEYDVHVDKKITEEFLVSMRSGVTLDDGYKTRKCVAKQKGTHVFTIILTEGEKRQIRRMCEAVGYRVQTLKRERIGSVHLGPLSPTQFRTLKGKELEIFFKDIGL